MSAAAGGEHLQHRTEMKCQVPGHPIIQFSIIIHACNGVMVLMEGRSIDGLHVFVTSIGTHVLFLQVIEDPRLPNWTLPVQE